MAKKNPLMVNTITGKPSSLLCQPEIQEVNETVKNPNWQEADQLAIYKRSQGIERIQIQLVVRAGLEGQGHQISSQMS